MGSLRLQPDDISDPNAIQSILKSCTCTDEEDDSERNYAYTEGTQRDNSMSDSKLELSENIWYEIKPPRLFIRNFNPAISSRQLYVTKILMDGGPSGLVSESKSDKINISMAKRKSAVRFLTQPHMNLEVDP